ncbi:hypothetical protein D5086_004364 [Populus alba]|uniref:Uncharacterized protein n=1 Tax=Populus alba TaxID=43335 RepID=A0ACC4CQ57_POPAL
MEILVSSRSNLQSLSEKYIFPEETRPGKVAIALCESIPVIDLGDIAGHNRANIAQEILKASQEFGFFQVINHGVSKALMNDTMSVFKEVFEMPAEDLAGIYSEDPDRSCRLFTSSNSYANEDVHNWRDFLRHPCHPDLDACIQQWPEKPTRYRQVVGNYSTEVMKLASGILELISEGLGLESGYFGGELSENAFLSVNRYPPCPDPSLTLGLPKHCDPNLITILLQGDVCGLQVFKDGEWIGVGPVPHALVINIGYQLQIGMSNTVNLTKPISSLYHGKWIIVYEVCVSKSFEKAACGILELISEGLGLESGYFGGDVCGLQVFKDGEWIGVGPVPNAFVINIGYQLQGLNLVLLGLVFDFDIIT